MPPVMCTPCAVLGSCRTPARVPAIHRPAKGWSALCQQPLHEQQRAWMFACHADECCSLLCHMPACRGCTTCSTCTVEHGERVFGQGRRPQHCSLLLRKRHDCKTQHGLCDKQCADWNAETRMPGRAEAAEQRTMECSEKLRAEIAQLQGELSRRAHSPAYLGGFPPWGEWLLHMESLERCMGGNSSTSYNDKPNALLCINRRKSYGYGCTP